MLRSSAKYIVPNQKNKTQPKKKKTTYPTFVVFLELSDFIFIKLGPEKKKKNQKLRDVPDGPHPRSSD